MSVDVLVRLPIKSLLNQLSQAEDSDAAMEMGPICEFWHFTKRYTLAALPRKGDLLNLPYPLLHGRPVGGVRWNPEVFTYPEVWLVLQTFKELDFGHVQAELTADLWVREPVLVERMVKVPVLPNFIKVQVAPDLPDGVAVSTAEGSEPVVIPILEEEVNLAAAAVEASSQEDLWGYGPLQVRADLAELIKALAARCVIPRPGEAESSFVPEHLPAWPALWSLAEELRRKYKLEV